MQASDQSTKLNRNRSPRAGFVVTAESAFVARSARAGLLPCNVCVWEDDGGSVVSIARPDAMFDIVKNGALQAVIQEADQRLRLALDQVKGNIVTKSEFV